MASLKQYISNIGISSVRKHSKCQKYLFENFEEIFEKKLDGRTPGLSDEVSWDEFGIPYIPCRGRVLRFVVPAWKVERSGTFREKFCGVALARPDGESGTILL